MRVAIPFGKETLPITISEDQMGELLRPPSLSAIDDVAAALHRELGSDHCAPALSRLGRMISGGDKPSVAIVVNDYTRPTPLQAVLPPLLDTLNNHGVDDSRIRIVVALGTHRPMREEEFKRQAGEQMLRRVGFINPRIDDPASLRSLGTAVSGAEVWVNRDYAQADFKIAVGTILPHGAVGFSGGAKLIYPGIAGRKTVEGFHVAANSDPQNQAGRLDSPIRGEIEKLVELVGLDLMINLVIDQRMQICALTAGHYVDSHRRAVPAARKLYGLPLIRASSLLLVGSAHADLDFWQAAKAIFNCQAAVEDGGWLVLLTPCPEGIPAEHSGFDRAIGLPAEQIEERLAQLARGETAEPGMDKVTLAPALALSRFRRRIRIAVISPGLTEQQVRRMGFRCFASGEEGLRAILTELPPEKRWVDVVTHGGSTYPYVSQRSSS